MRAIYLSLGMMKKNQAKKLTLIDSGNEVNVIILSYMAQLDLKVWSTNIKAQKIDILTFKIFEIVLTSFQVKDKLGRTHFFQTTFLIVNISMAMTLSILFPTFNNRNVLIWKQELIWKSYITSQALPTTKQVQIISQKEFAVATLGSIKKVFIMYVACLGSKILVYPIY